MTQADHWHAPAITDGAKRLARDIGMPELIGMLLHRRGIKDPSEARRFLNPSLSNLVDPEVFPDMEWGTEILAEAIINRKKVLVYGDYDADGITGTSCLLRFLRELGAEAGYILPNRLLDGYGVHAHLVEKAISEGYSVIVTVDCGSTDTSSLKLALSSGVNVIVTDHHRVPEGMAGRWPIINPKRLNQTDGLWELSGASMAFFLAASLRRHLRKKGFFKGRREPNLREYLDLVSVGMVADRVKVLGQARVLIANGVEQLAKTKDLAMQYLKNLSGIDQRVFNVEDIGFRIAPRINAPGRIDDPDIALRALISRDEGQIKILLDLMESLNQKRRSMEEWLLREVESQIQSKYQSVPPFILCKGEDWHEGVLGLVASKISSKYYRPSLILKAKGQVIKGSGRSIPEIDLYDLINTQRHLLLRYGGHSGAIGLTVRPEVLVSLEEGLSNAIGEKVDIQSLTPRPYIDMELDLRDLKHKDIEALSILAPFGDGNPEPTFLCKGAQIVATKVVGGEHLRLILRRGDKIFSGICFGKAPLKDYSGMRVDLIYVPRLELYKGHSLIELKILDLRPSLA